MVTQSMVYLCAYLQMSGVQSCEGCNPLNVPAAPKLVSWLQLCLISQSWRRGGVRAGGRCTCC